MERIPEPELMAGEEQALAYARADFSEPHTRVIELFREEFAGDEGLMRRLEGPAGPGSSFLHVLDLGCGPGDICFRFAEAFPGALVDGIDGSPAMLAASAGLLAKAAPRVRSRVRLAYGLLPDDEPPLAQYDVVISNSLLHHLGDPSTLWDAVRTFAKPRAPVFIVDLMRPASEGLAREFTERYCEGEPEILRHDFHSSLLAAYEVDEIRGQLTREGLDESLSVRAISDRHLLVAGFTP